MDESKRKAILAILYALRNPLVMMSIPDREHAMKLATEHNITALELLEFSRERYQRA